MNIEPGRMQIAAEAAETLLKAVGNRHRLMILCQILEGEQSVGDLASLLGLRTPTVSQHLSLLRKDGLVTTRREGQTIWYSIASEPARRLVETLYQIYCAPSDTREAVSGRRKSPAAKKGRKR